MKQPPIAPIVAWILLVGFNSTVVAYLAPFIGPNIVVPVAGGYQYLDSTLLEVSQYMGAPLAGGLIGLLAWSVARSRIRPGRSRSPLLPTVIFAMAALLAASACFLGQVTMFTGYPVTCLIGLILWPLSLVLPLWLLYSRTDMITAIIRPGPEA